jgi:hypothetical protein
MCGRAELQHRSSKKGCADDVALSRAKETRRQLQHLAQTQKSMREFIELTGILDYLERRLSSSWLLYAAQLFDLFYCPPNVTDLNFRQSAFVVRSVVHQLREPAISQLPSPTIHRSLARPAFIAGLENTIWLL